MDVTGLLAATVAMAVFPGGLYLAAAALLAGRGSWRRWTSVTGAEMAGLAALTFAGALVPLPGAPAQLIPTTEGAASNLLALLLLAGVGLGLAAGPAWSRWRVAAAGAVALPLLALAAQGSTFSAAAVAGLGGGRLEAARLLAALALVIAAPCLAGAGDPGGGPEAAIGAAPAQATMAGLCAVLAVAVGLPQRWSSLPGLAVAALALLMAAVVGAALGERRRGWVRLGGAVALLPAAVAAGLALVRG